jgi:hypothetical protein
MRENEFEKQVRKLMDDFQLSPSASVWEQVRARILQRRRRWPLVALLLLSMLSTGYLMYHQFEGDSAIIQAKENNAAEKNAAAQNNGGVPKQDNAMVQQPLHSSKNNAEPKKPGADRA